MPRTVWLSLPTACLRPAARLPGGTKAAEAHWWGSSVRFPFGMLWTERGGRGTLAWWGGYASASVS